MKNATKYILLFSIIFYLKSAAQHTSKSPSNHQILSDNKTFKGKRELRKEKRIHRATAKLASKNERKERIEHNLGTTSTHKSKSKKIAKENRKKSKEEKKSKG